MVIVAAVGGARVQARPLPDAINVVFVPYPLSRCASDLLPAVVSSDAALVSHGCVLAASIRDDHWPQLTLHAGVVWRLGLDFDGRLLQLAHAVSS